MKLNDKMHDVVEKLFVTVILLSLATVISIMLMKYGRPARYTILPMIFILITSSWAALIKLKEFYDAENWLLVTIDVVVVITTFLVILEAASVISKIRREGSSAPETN